jgi:hypothetical protein
MTKLNIFNSKRLLAAAVAVTASALLTSSANASYLFKYSSSATAHYTNGANPTDNDLGFDDSKLGSILCVINQDGSQSGGLNSAFSFLLNWRGFFMNYTGQGNPSGNPTCVVVQDSNNNCYVWDVSQCWDGTGSLDFSDICAKGSHITSITCYGDSKTPSTTTSVPEPSTVIAGALLLLPLGISMTRILRRSKMQPVIK